MRIEGCAHFLSALHSVCRDSIVEVSAKNEDFSDVHILCLTSCWILQYPPYLHRVAFFDEFHKI